MTITALHIGTRVTIGPSDDPIVATVLALSVRGIEPLIQYECVWWEGKTRKSEWLSEGEVTPEGKKPLTMRIGFSAEVTP